jgi:alpha/beta hydrolase family protein
MSRDFNDRRRRFLGTTAMTLAAARFGGLRSAHALISANTSFGPLKQINAGLLSVGYAEAGPPNGPAVILLHGWPYDIHSYVDVAPLLASSGYRVIVPHLRGYGSTRFLSRDTFRNGQPSVVAVDAIALMDALKIDKAIIGGFDWGARTGHHGGAVAGPVQRRRLRQRIPHREPGIWQNAVAASGRVPVMVPILFCD